ncbi:unnamed protein product [Cylindrotheca closterium]|uniref:Uncharacterized protein n=1 Tax=Cylindrotheca closterium TaxID=2856 RepID=A0AAD2FNS0_9STRA|nr:unnamed protein product [Cylindrotheca closterium]
MSEASGRDYDDIYMPTVPQQKAISFLVLPFCLLSFLGSAAIVRYVLKDKKKSAYRRLMLSISICDMISTSNFAFHPFLGPADSIRAWVYFVGNDATCTVLGALGQFSWSTHLYTASLSYYFVLTVRYGVRDEVFARKLEPWIHAVVMTWSFSTTISGIVMDAYHESETSPSCWVSAKPGEDCWNDSCGAERLAWIFGGIPNVFCFLSVTINNILLYRYVRRTIVTSQRNARLAEDRMSKEFSQRDLSMADMKESLSPVSKQDAPSPQNKENGSEKPMFASFRGTRKPKSIMRSSDRLWERVRQVGIQSFLYVSSYILCFGPTVIRQMLDGRGVEKTEGARKIFLPLLFIQGILLPSQGTFFCIIFFRPKYLQNRKMQPDRSRFWAAISAMKVEKKRVLVIQEPPKHNRRGTDNVLKAVDENQEVADVDAGEAGVTRLSEMSDSSSVDSVMPSVSSRVDTTAGTSTQTSSPAARRSIISILSGASHRRSTASSGEDITATSMSCSSDLKLSNNFSSAADHPEGSSSHEASESSDAKRTFLRVDGFDIPVNSSLYST